MPYNNKLDANEQISAEEAIAAYLFNNTESDELNEETCADLSRALLYITLLRFRPDLIEGQKAPMTANEYQKQALRTEHTPMFINPAVVGGEDNAIMLSRILHGVIGVVTEIGEAADMLKKHLIYGKPLDLTNLMEEAGDKQWYIALILHASGYSMSEALERNIAKLAKRYPDKFTPERVLNRDLAAERATLECGHHGPIPPDSGERGGGRDDLG